MHRKMRNMWLTTFLYIYIVHISIFGICTHCIAKELGVTHRVVDYKILVMNQPDFIALVCKLCSYVSSVNRMRFGA